MAASSLSSVLGSLHGRTTLGAEEALCVRRAVFSDLGVSSDEAEALISLNDGADQTSAEWRTLYVEALTDYVVRQQHPPGYVDEVKADWLAAALQRNGRIKGDTELELLIHVLETADRAPASLADFGLEQVTRAVAEDGRVGEVEVEQLRRLIYAGGGPGALAVTRAEADRLFDIHDLSRGADNARAWDDLFVRCVGCSVLSAYVDETPDAATEQRRRDWLASPNETLDHLFGRIGEEAGRFFLNPRGEAAAARAHDPTVAEGWAEHNDRVARVQAWASQVTAEEADWLRGRLTKHAQLDDSERALVSFIAKEASSLDPAFADLIARATVPIAQAA